MQIRQAMRSGYGFGDKLAGIVEVDDAYIGAPKPGKRGRGAAGKHLVVIAADPRASHRAFEAMRIGVMLSIGRVMVGEWS